MKRIRINSIPRCALTGRENDGRTWGDGLTEKAVWHVVREHARKAGIETRVRPEQLAMHLLQGPEYPGAATPQSRRSVL
jgi:hypothetical protein